MGTSPRLYNVCYFALFGVILKSLGKHMVTSFCLKFYMVTLLLTYINMFPLFSIFHFHRLPICSQSTRNVEDFLDNCGAAHG